MSKTKKAVLLIILILLVDQAVKIYIKLNFSLGEDHPIFSWFRIYFIENNGMAFGMEFIGKLFLTLFRIVAVAGLSYYIHILVKRNFSTGYILTVSLVLAGAAGNIIDSVFYGVIFSESTYMGPVATLFPDGGGYSGLFYGKVVDMLYFPIIQIQSMPDWWYSGDSFLLSWLPKAGEKFIFFSPIFNIADSAISVAVVIILLFYRKELNESLESKKEKNAEPAE